MYELLGISFISFLLIGFPISFSCCKKKSPNERKEEVGGKHKKVSKHHKSQQKPSRSKAKTCSPSERTDPAHSESVLDAEDVFQLERKVSDDTMKDIPKSLSVMGVDEEGAVKTATTDSDEAKTAISDQNQTAPSKTKTPPIKGKAELEENSLKTQQTANGEDKKSDKTEVITKEVEKATEKTQQTAATTVRSQTAPADLEETAKEEKSSREESSGAEISFSGQSESIAAGGTEGTAADEEETKGKETQSRTESRPQSAPASEKTAKSSAAEMEKSPPTSSSSKRKSSETKSSSRSQAKSAAQKEAKRKAQIEKSTAAEEQNSAGSEGENPTAEKQIPLVTSAKKEDGSEVAHTAAS